MNKRIFTKRILAITLSIIMVLSLTPMTAFAYPGDGGATLTSNDPGQYDMDGRPLLVFVTPNGGDVSRTKGGNSDSTQQFTATANNGWFFKTWRTYYKGITSDAANPNHTWDSEWCFSQPGNSKAKPDLSYKTIQVNREFDAAGTFYLYAIFNPLITVQIDEGVNAYHFRRLLADGEEYLGASSKESRQFSNAEYGCGLRFSFCLNDNYVPVRVSLNGETTTFDNLANNYLSLTGPVTVEVTTRLKNSIVQFDANGGEGSMDAQTFEHSVAQALTANNFTKTGYTFAGWNTKADGTGTAYADKQSVTLMPANDGDSFTLYAQWSECTDHEWADGVCAECGKVCSHSGGNATCVQKATCEICGEQYGNLTEHNIVYSASDNRIVETCTAGCGHTAAADIVRDENISTVYSGIAIEALKVSYSDNWQGGDMAITYSNNIDVGDASGSISIGGVAASETFAIMAASMTGVSAQGYSGIYDGQKHSITVNAPEGATVTYRIGDGEYSVKNPAFTNAGTYTIHYKVTLANHSDYEGYAQVKIDKAPLTVTANDKTIIYGDTPANGGVSYIGFVEDENADVLGGMLGYDYGYTQYGDVGNYDIISKGLTSDNYEITFTKGVLTVLQKEIGINWDNTVLTYDGTAQMPTATAIGTANGDQLVLTIEGIATNASSSPYTATVIDVSGEKAGNYKLPGNVSTEFTIGKADQEAPAVGKIDETISQKSDGKITDVTLAMEYRKDSEEAYSAITGSTVENLAAGKYYIRVKEDSNHNPSPDTEVVIEAGRMLTVTVPQNQVGYTLTVDAAEINYMDDLTIALVIADGYSKTENFAVKLNGEDMKWGDFVETDVQSCTEDIVITVEGVADTTAPNAVIGIKNNKWTSLLDDITFGLFFNESQDVTITATDNGSGVNTIQYYLASSKLELDEVRLITDWEGYNGVFKIDPNNHYVVYVKVTDSAGNIMYINSDGITLDNIVPVLEGIESGKTYYGDLTVIKSDEQFYDIKEVTLDGKPMDFNEDTFGIIPADNAEHIVVIEDYAGNKTTYTVIVYKNYTVTFKVDGNIIESQTVGYGMNAVLPKVPDKYGYTGEWNHNGKNITADTEIVAVYTENTVAVNDGDVQPPQTEDESNLVLWLVIFFISGCAMIKIAVNERKQRNKV